MGILILGTLLAVGLAMGVGTFAANKLGIHEAIGQLAGLGVLALIAVLLLKAEDRKRAKLKAQPATVTVTQASDASSQPATDLTADATATRADASSQADASEADASGAVFTDGADAAGASAGAFVDSAGTSLTDSEALPASHRLAEGSTDWSEEQGEGATDAASARVAETTSAHGFVNAMATGD